QHDPRAHGCAVDCRHQRRRRGGGNRCVRGAVAPRCRPADSARSADRVVRAARAGWFLSRSAVVDARGSGGAVSTSAALPPESGAGALSAAELGDAVARGDLDPEFAARAALERAVAIGACDRSALNILLYTDADAAAQASAVGERRRRRGAEPGPLAGVPVVLKDNIATTALPTTCGSRIL